MLANFCGTGNKFTIDASLAFPRATSVGFVFQQSFLAQHLTNKLNMIRAAASVTLMGHTGREGGTVDVEMRHFAHALEDLPEEVRQQAAEIAATEPGISLRRRILDQVETVGLDLYGTLEQAPLLRFLADYPVTPYTYQLTPVVARGQRPDARKLAGLAARQYRNTVNLCAEMDEGDAPAIAAAGLTGMLRTRHVPITDMEPPTVAQVTQLLDLLSAPDAGLTYVHCEAGRARTGVVIACYRMAVMGWSADDALTEAVNFGCSVPGQQAFIREYGDLLLAGGPSAGRYPLLPLGSVKPTAAELAATLAGVAAAEKDALRSAAPGL